MASTPQIVGNSKDGEMLPTSVEKPFVDNRL